MTHGCPCYLLKILGFTNEYLYAFLFRFAAIHHSPMDEKINADVSNMYVVFKKMKLLNQGPVLLLKLIARVSWIIDTFLSLKITRRKVVKTTVHFKGNQ